MDNSASVCNFIENLPKRQKYFQCFLEVFKVGLNLPETKWKEIIGLAKTRCVERYKACDTYYLLYNATVSNMSQLKKEII